MKLSIVNEIAAKPRSWLKPFARKLRNWLDDFLAEDAATADGSHSDQGERMSGDAAEFSPEDASPPDHWLALIREHAPELLISRDEHDRSPVEAAAASDLSDGNPEEVAFPPGNPEIKLEHSEQMNTQIPMRNSYSSPIASSNTPTTFFKRSNSNDQTEPENKPSKPGPRTTESSDSAPGSKLCEQISEAAPVQVPRSSEPCLREMSNVPVPASNPNKRSNATFETLRPPEDRRKKSPPNDKAFRRFPAVDFNRATGSESNTVPLRKTTASVQPSRHVQVSSSAGKSPAEVQHRQDEHEQPAPKTRTDLPPNWTPNLQNARSLNPDWIAWKNFPHSLELPAHQRPQPRDENYSVFHDEFHHRLSPIEPRPSAAAERTWLEHDLWPELPVEPPPAANWTKSITASEHIAFLEREQRGGH